jgi:catechol 2,3-dioxygenase-like lactoylglutathione lyase family enzyme
MMTLTHSRVVYLIVYVRDLPTSRAYYEGMLGLRVLEEDAESVKYDGGTLILCLNRASDYGVHLPDGRDESAQIVFLVRDIDDLQAALERRGVEFAGGMKYEVGAVADFYDPDGHHLVLYEPSEEALTWPSGEKISAVWAVAGEEPFTFDLSTNGHDHATATVGSRTDLAGAPVVYLFFFVTDPDRSLEFYNDHLGLEALEGGPCSRTSGGDEEGVVKYNAGGLILSTHHLDMGTEERHDDGHVCPPREFDPTLSQGVAPVFHVSDIEDALAELSGKGIPTPSGVVSASIGKVARFDDPSGHLYFLYEPSSEALSWPSGARIRDILQSPY